MEAEVHASPKRTAFGQNNHLGLSPANGTRVDGQDLMENQSNTTRIRAVDSRVHPHSFKNRSYSLWLWEIGCAVVSLACMALVMWALFSLNNKQLSTWHLAVRPNSFVSIFITSAKFFALPLVGTGIAQLRWQYFLSAPRRLDHLDIFDAATKGEWGCLSLLRETAIDGKIPLVARWGAAIILIALAMDPFAQQILGYPTRNVECPNDGGTWIPATREWALEPQLLSDGT